MRIDAHQHFWELARGDYGWLTSELAAIYKDFHPHDLDPMRIAAGMDGTIVVQATDTLAETQYLLSLADSTEWIYGVVGWVDMEADDATQQIERLATHSKIVGLRPMIQGIRDDNWMLRSTIAPALAAMQAHNLTFDALIMPRHLDVLPEFLQRYPELRVVIDHGAKPEIRNGLFDPWSEKMRKIADISSAYCKISGLTTEAGEGWNEDDIIPYIHHLIECFGANRLLYGSDWPVCNLASSYDGWLRLVDKGMDMLDDGDKQRIMGLNAVQAYNLH